jgi:predicted enzyme related to lactoylglutathione lyase
VPRPVHFEIHASDPDAAQAFYAEVFGWTIERWGEVPYWVITTGDASEAGINGGLLPREGAPPAGGEPINAFVITIEVPDCAGYVDRAVRAGGTVALPMTAMPGVGWVAYVKDPDGNIFGLIQPEPEQQT